MFNWKTYALLGLISGQVLAQNAQIVRFDLTPQVKTFLRAHDFDVTGVNYHSNEIEALLSDSEIELLKAQKVNFKFSFPQSLMAAPDQRYLNPDEVVDILQKAHANYPDITELKSIGKSVEGKDIWAIKISDNVKSDELEPTIFFNGMHHAREVMTPEITTDMVTYFTSNYGKDPKVTKWVNETEIWIVPMVNVDGNNKMWNEDSMWRKNTRGGYGVDINRNYPEGWNSCNGSSSMRDSQTFRGDAPGSEPETQAIMNFVAKIKPVFSISYHAYSELVLYPFGCRPSRTPTEEAVETIGKEMALKMKYKPGTPWELLYNADGGDIDWMYKAHQVIPYVIEVNSSWDGGFHPNYEKHRNKTVELNRLGWMHLFERLNGSSIQGAITNKKQYSQINIFKAGVKAQSYKINPDGTFFIILKPGTYDVQFVGQEEKRLNNLVINSKKLIVL